MRGLELLDDDDGEATELGVVEQIREHEWNLYFGWVLRHVEVHARLHAIDRRD